MIRVLHIIGQMNRAGAETFIMNVYRHIDRSQIQFDFAVHTDQPGHYDEEILALGGRILHHKNPKILHFAAYARALSDTLRKQGPFAGVHSHVHFFSGYILRLAEKAGVPLRLAHAHSTSDGQKNSLLWRIYRWYMRMLIHRHGTHLLGNSRASCEAVYGSTCWQDLRVRVIQNAIDLTPYKVLPDNRQALRTKLALPLDVPLIGHIGRFDIPKNHRYLIKVFEALLHKLPAAHLILLGDGVLRPEIERLVDSAGVRDNVHFLGVRSDVSLVIGCLDLLLLPSLWEGLGIVLIEAQAAGVPCVVSDAVTKEADLNLGLTQFVSLKEDVGVWTNLILQGLKSHRPAWPYRERALQAAGYDIHQMSELLQEIYTSG
jgi:glycosyltransferase involved in cell wall biosynthesis